MYHHLFVCISSKNVSPFPLFLMFEKYLAAHLLLCKTNQFWIWPMSQKNPMPWSRFQRSQLIYRYRYTDQSMLSVEQSSHSKFEIDRLIRRVMSKLVANFQCRHQKFKNRFFCTTARKCQLLSVGAKRKLALSGRECRKIVYWPWPRKKNPSVPYYTIVLRPESRNFCATALNES